MSVASDALHAANLVRDAMRRNEDLDQAAKQAMLNRGYENVGHWASANPKELVAFARGIELMLAQEAEVNDMVNAYAKRVPRHDR